MRTRCSLAFFCLAAVLGCGASNSKPKNASDGEKVDDRAEPTEEAKDSSEAPTPPPMGTVKRGSAAQDVPDDYSLTENDCQALGRQYAASARADQLIGVSPKVTPKQREQAEASIDAAVSKLESQWTETCVKSLAGKIVDHKHVTCALAAKTVKAFDSCLNDEGT
jgi:hypothetical protein